MNENFSSGLLPSLKRRIVSRAMRLDTKRLGEAFRLLSCFNPTLLNVSYF